MQVHKTPIEGLFVFEPTIFKDQRGYFYESYNKSKLAEFGINTIFVQDNESKSTQSTIRGLHYQKSPYAQTKLVRVLEGIVYDVAVDLRKNSPTFGHWYGVELSAENKKQFYIPQGFAHGFSVLSETAVFAYKCDNFYNKESEGGIRFNDPTLNIDWKIEKDKVVVSEKDTILPLFADTDYNF